MTQTFKLLTLARASPTTSSEAAAITGLSVEYCSAILGYLWRQGMLKREKFAHSGPGQKFIYQRKS